MIFGLNIYMSWILTTTPSSGRNMMNLSRSAPWTNYPTGNVNKPPQKQKKGRKAKKNFALYTDIVKEKLNLTGAYRRPQ
jgi:hypothetical protein